MMTDGSVVIRSGYREGTMAKVVKRTTIRRSWEKTPVPMTIVEFNDGERFGYIDSDLRNA